MSFPMTFDLIYLVYAFVAYLIGSISTAIITCKLMGLKDPRTIGSNNPGATNVLREGGKKAAIITLLGDMLKGLLPVLIVAYLSSEHLAMAAAGMGAFIGHLYPLYFGFKGGKGVATFYGVLLGFNWLAGLSALCVWLLSAFISKISSLSALVSALTAPVIIWVFTNSPVLVITTALLTLILYWKHRSNIINIIQGKEDKIGPRPDLDTDSD